jgi:hypothetical protein
MLPELLRAIEKYVGNPWRVTTARSGDDYIVDIDCGLSLVRIRGKSVEHAEQRAAALLERRGALKKAAQQEGNLEGLLRASLAQKRRKRGEPQLRLVRGPGEETPETEEVSGAADEPDEEDPRE